MKIRMGFVSNSSTSSYVIIITKDVFESALTSMPSEDAKGIRKAFMSKTLGGTELYYYGYIMDMGGGIHPMSESEEIDYEALHEFSQKIGKNCINIDMDA